MESADQADRHPVDYEYIKSRGAHSVHAHDRFDAFVGSDREIWLGGDGSGLIRSSSGPVSFFSDAGRARWEAAGSPTLSHGPNIDLFAPGCLGTGRARRARLFGHPDGLHAALTARSPLSLKTVQGLLSEAVVEPELCRAIYEVALGIPGVEVVDQIADQLGRRGHGLVRIEHAQRLELIFSPDTGELLAYQRFLSQARDFAPEGTLISWSAFLTRRIVDRLPAEIPPLPALPCDPPGAGRGFHIRPGFDVMTGYVDDPCSQLAKLHEQGVLTDEEYASALASARGD